MSWQERVNGLKPNFKQNKTEINMQETAGTKAALESRPFEEANAKKLTR